MSQMSALLVIAALLLIPLIPAAVLYKVLSPKRKAADAEGDAPPGEGSAQGTLSADGLVFGKAKLSFNVVGSTATYVVLLAVAIATYIYMQNEAEKRAERIAQSMSDNQAWNVRVPISLSDKDGNPMPNDGTILTQVRVDTQPELTTRASATEITFRVVTTDKFFPTARFILPSLDPAVLDLNDTDKVRRDYTNHQLTANAPVWIVARDGYLAGGGDLPPYQDDPQHGDSASANPATPQPKENSR